jgi:hypothetical protein
VRVCSMAMRDGQLIQEVLRNCRFHSWQS